MMESNSDDCSMAVAAAGPLDHLPKCSWNDVRVNAHIGNGAFAMVLKVTSKEMPSSPLAMKHIKLGELDSMTAQQADEDLQEEARILSKLNHPNIVSIEAQGNIPQDDSFFFLMECLHDETLESRLCSWRQQRQKDMQKKLVQLPRLFRRKRSTTRRHNEGTATVVPSLFDRLHDIGYRLAQALDYLHKNQIIHSDIKPENVGFDRISGDVKLFDFGLSKDVSHHGFDSSSSSTTIESICGSPRYMSPDLLLAYPTTFGSDVFAFGVMIWELVTLERPHQEIRDFKGIMDKVVHRDERLCLDTVESIRLRALLNGCWYSETFRRLGSNGVVDGLREVLTELKQKEQQEASGQEHRQEKDHNRSSFTAASVLGSRFGLDFTAKTAVSERTASLASSSTCGCEFTEL